jgi:methylenetetrahydrofolate dehydrogenase (NADP+)/methenyltetrahydrofolate cyclohydrolase
MINFMTQILNAAPIRKKITKELKAQCLQLKSKNITPFLKVILVGTNSASLIYTQNKQKYCERVGAKCEIISLPQTITEQDLLSTIHQINLDSEVHGLIIQLPLPKHLAHLDIGKLIKQEKDVDGFHPENLYSLMRNDSGCCNFISCTPKGILTLLNEYQIELSNKNIIIIGRSMIVGKPLSMLLCNQNATVTLAHSHTKNLPELTARADVIISAIGIPHFIDRKFLSLTKNQILIDVGMNRMPSGEICGDINFSDVEHHVKAITPVPGGVGPMTIISLVQNLLQAASNRLSF